MALQLIRRARLLAAAGLIAVSLAAPLAASAAEGGDVFIWPRYSHGATVDVTGTSYEGKLLVTVTFALVCDPFQRWDGQTVVDGRIGGSAAMIQAQGRSVIGGTGYASQDVVCDGSTVNSATVPIFADSVTFRRGEAIVGASMYVCERPYGSCWADASSGPVSVKLR